MAHNRNTGRYAALGTEIEFDQIEEQTNSFLPSSDEEYQTTQFEQRRNSKLTKNRVYNGSPQQRQVPTLRYKDNF